MAAWHGLGPMLVELIPPAMLAVCYEKSPCLIINNLR